MVDPMQHHSDRQNTPSHHSSIEGDRDIDTIVNMELSSDVDDPPTTSKPGERNIRFAENHKKGPSIYIKQQSNQNHDMPCADNDVIDTQQQQHQGEKDSKPKQRHLSVIGRSIATWFDHALRDQSNRHALQVAIGFTIGALFVIIQPINNTFANTVWVSFTVVMVLDNTVGGLLNLSLRRMLGTAVGGILAMIGMTIVKVIFPDWGVAADIVLLCYLFIQVFFIAKCKKWPNLANASSIGLLTTAVIALSGYTNLAEEDITHSVVLASWRMLNVILGIVIAMLAAFVFPIQASRTMRTNLGNALEETADLFESTAEYYLEIKATKAPPLFKPTPKRSTTMSSSSSQPIYVKSPFIYIQRTGNDHAQGSSASLTIPDASSNKPKSISVASVLSQSPSPSQSPFQSPSQSDHPRHHLCYLKINEQRPMISLKSRRHRLDNSNNSINSNNHIISSISNNTNDPLWENSVILSMERVTKLSRYSTNSKPNLPVCKMCQVNTIYSSPSIYSEAIANGVDVICGGQQDIPKPLKP
ncbi:unnamed protein product [Absidia cylindrospora]